MHYYHKLVTIVLNEGVLSFQMHKSFLLIVNCNIGVTYKDVFWPAIELILPL